MQIQKEHTREQILQAAEQAFHQQGFAKTSMRDIARLSGVGVGNLYNYFPWRHTVPPIPVPAYDCMLLRVHSPIDGATHQ